MPFEVVTKLLVLPGAVVTVLFPLFSSLTAQGSGEAGRLHRLGIRYVALAMFVPVFAASLFAREGLGLWLGPEFAEAAQRVVQLIALGCLLNGVAAVPFALLQGAGRPDVTAKLHLLELPVYVLLVAGLTLRLGITGTALAWALRMGLDLVALLLLAQSSTEPSSHPATPGLAAVALATAVFATSFLPLPLVAKAMLFPVVVVAEAILIWRVLLDRDGLGHVKRQILGFLRFPTEEG
jgi:O-antigen/teichoic acid export membrane protein